MVTARTVVSLVRRLQPLQVDVLELMAALNFTLLEDFPGITKLNSP